MRILIISHFFPPVNAVASLRAYSWAKYWSRMGHEVTVLTSAKPPGDNPLLCALEGFEVVEEPSIYVLLHSLIKRGAKGGVFHKHGTKEPREGLISRLLGFFQHRYGIFWSARMPDHMDFWIWPAVRAARRLGRFDLVVSTFGPYASHVVAYFVKRSQGSNWIADYRDLWTDSYLYPGLWPFTIIEQWLERKLLDFADAITTVSIPLAESLSRKYGDKVSVIENGFDEEDLRNLSEESIYADDGKVRLVYTGSIYTGRRNPSPLFEAVDLLKREHPSLKERLEILFAGAHMGDLEELIRKYNVGDCVKVCGNVLREDALRMQRDADALVFLDWDDPTEPGVLTGKLFEYLFSDRPVLLVGAGPESSAGKLITEVRRGLCLGNDVERIASVLDDLLNGRPIMVASHHERLAAYTREALASKMLSLVSEESQQEKY